MNDHSSTSTPILLMPFVLVWRLLGFFIRLSRRIVAALLGLVLMVAGVALTMSVIAAAVGIPLSIFGFLLLVRALF
ncbi:MAG: hypothetical protein KDI09_17915 [Halioglobus sp.]|nr:hypothetical protein [Halioglobus sp.]